MSDDEVHYVFVKGEGWVPRPGPEPETEDKLLLSYANYNADEIYIAANYERAAREWQRLIRDIPTYHMPTGTRVNTNEGTTTRHWRVAYQVHDEIILDYEPNTPQQITRREPNPGTPGPATRTRYFAGAGERPVTEPIEETPRARNIREYRERFLRRDRRP